MANMAKAVALMKKLSEAERARGFKVAQQHEKLLKAQQQAAAMSKKAAALKSALDLSEAEHARREYASSVGMASPARLLKNPRLHPPGSGNPGARKKHASRTSPSREGASSRFGGATKDSTAVAQLNFDGDASGMCAAGQDSLMQCLGVSPDGGFDQFFADDLGGDDDSPDGKWSLDAFRSRTPSPPNGHMPE
jgi:hypothetical protein